LKGTVAAFCTTKLGDALRLQDTQRFGFFRMSSDNEDVNKDHGRRKRSKFT